jgi:hypothetical protein
MITKSEKIYWGKKPKYKEIPKPFPLSIGITLFEDEIGWYSIWGEITLEDNDIKEYKHLV